MVTVYSSRDSNSNLNRHFLLGLTYIHLLHRTTAPSLQYWSSQHSQQFTVAKQHLSILQEHATTIENDAHPYRIQQWRSFSGSGSGRSHVYTSAIICNFALNPQSTPLIALTMQRHLVINIPPMLCRSPLLVRGNHRRRIYPACKLKPWLCS
jgi:hypothetical protein